VGDKGSFTTVEIEAVSDHVVLLCQLDQTTENHPYMPEIAYVGKINCAGG
jgi:hypothetical protein